MKKNIITSLSIFCLIFTTIAEQKSQTLFPILNVTLGVTTEQELKKLGQKDREFNMYTIRGQNFWVKNGLAHHMYMAKPLEWPKKWRNLDFSWYLSYNEWITTLKKIGYKVTVIEPPRIELYNGHKSLNAKVRATKQERKLIELTLNFQYSKATKTNQVGSLYSISIKYK